LKNEKGFTLIELIVVIAILGIIAAIAVPKFGSYREEAKINTLKTNTHTLEQYVQYLAILEDLSFEYKSYADGGDPETYMSRRVETELEDFNDDYGDGNHPEKYYLNKDGYTNFYSGNKFILNADDDPNYLGYEKYKNPAVYVTDSSGIPAEPIENLKGSIVIQFPNSDSGSVEIFYVDFDGNESSHKVIER